VGYDPTKETHAIESQVDVDGVPVTVRITVQGDGVVAGTFVVAQGYVLAPARADDISFASAARKALKDAPDEVRNVGQEGGE
jgi:hypothetical protein